MSGKYEHGIYTPEKATEMTSTTKTAFAQVVIGTAPVHMTDNPSAAVNKPILCEDMADCEKKLGYSSDFKKYTVCQAMFASVNQMKVAPLVFINVLDPAKHFTEVAATEKAVTDNSITIEDAVIVSTLKITAGEVEISSDKYVTEWVNEKLVINFVDNTEGPVSVAYNKVDPEKVTYKDVIGEYDTETEKRTGAELIKSIYPMYGVIPYIIIAPGWSQNALVGAVLANKTNEINGCYKAWAFCDLDTEVATTKAKAIEEKKGRTFNENCIAFYPMVKKNDKVIAYSAWAAAVMMSLATQTDGMPFSNLSNVKIGIDDCVLADGTSIYYDQEDGNELNAEGIVTIIARNGWYTWGNNTTAYPTETDPIKRWIMTRSAFMAIENDFINRNYEALDKAISKKNIENLLISENIKLAAYANAGYISGGKMEYVADDNTEADILNGHFKFRTALAPNIPTEVIENEYSFDIDTLKTAILGGEQ